MSQNLTVIGNLADDPELRFTSSGKAVCTFQVITSKSRKDEQTGKWESSDQTAWKITTWDRFAENCAETLLKGFPVVVYGNAVLRKFDKKDGSVGYSLEVNAYHVGLDLKRFSAKANVVARDDARPVADGDPWGQPAADPWTTTPSLSTPLDEPPF